MDAEAHSPIPRSGTPGGASRGEDHAQRDPKGETSEASESDVPKLTQPPTQTRPPPGNAPPGQTQENNLLTSPNFHLDPFHQG